MAIRPFVPEDANQVKQLLRHVWGDDEMALTFCRFGGSTHTIVAEHEGRLVGLGSVWTKRIHPHALYFSLAVHPAYQRQGIGSSLLAHLTALNERRLPLQTSTWESSPRGIQFLKRHGFVEFRRTYEPVLPISVVDQASYQFFDARCSEAGYRIASLADLSVSPDRNARVAALAAEIYQAAHQANPPAVLSLREWEDLTFGEPLVEDGSFVALKDGEFAAISLLHPVENPGMLSFGWRGVAHAHLNCQRDLILALTLRQVGHAAGQGFAFLHTEADTTDPWAMLQLECLPFRPAPAWMTFQKPAET